MAWRTLRQQLLGVVLLALAGGVLGSMFDLAAWGVGLALGLYLLRQLIYLAWLRAWLEQPKRTELPEPTGTWGEVYSELFDLQRRNRRRKKRLASMLAQFQASAQALPDGALVLEARGEIVWFNAKAQSLLGLRARQDLGQRVPNLLRHPEFTAYFERGDFRSEVEVPSPVNRRLMLSLRIIPYGDRQRLLLVRDVSELHRLDRVRRDFVANASHELRTPLTVLRGYLEVMQSDAKGEGSLETWRTPLAEMHAQATRMEALIRDLLKLARLEGEATTHHASVLDVPTMLERIVADLRSLSQGRHRIDAEIENGLLLQGHETEVESIFSNLASNAAQYTPVGGSIHLRWATDGAGACFEVRDSGIGVALEDIPRLTERFYRVDEGRSRASGGTGLGLSIVKHALERHDGRLQVESTPGKGSCFRCAFPEHRVTRTTVLAANG